MKTRRFKKIELAGPKPPPPGCGTGADPEAPPC